MERFDEEGGKLNIRRERGRIGGPNVGGNTAPAGSFQMDNQIERESKLFPGRGEFVRKVS